MTAAISGSGSCRDRMVSMITSTVIRLELTSAQRGEASPAEEAVKAKPLRVVLFCGNASGVVGGQG